MREKQRQAVRTRERRPEERPQEIMDAALEIFSANGYRATRLDEIAARAGVTKGAIYHHFSGKDDLLVRAVRSRLRSVLTEVEDALTHQRGPASMRLRFVLRRVWSYWCQPEWVGLFRLMIGELKTEFPSLVDAWLEEGPGRGWRVIEQILEEGRSGGEFRPDIDSRVAARFVVCGLGMQAVLQAHFQLEDPASFDPDRVFDSSVDVFIRGLQASSWLHR